MRLTPCAPASVLESSALLGTHYEFQKGAFVSSWEQAGSSIRVLSEISSLTMWNHVACLDRCRDGWPEFFAYARDTWPQPARPPAVYWIDSQNSAGITPEAALQCGFERCDQEAWMTGDPTASLPVAEAALEVRRVQCEGEMEDFIQVFEAAYQTKRGKYARVLRSFRNPGQGERHAEHYLGYAADQPVCIATLLVQNDLAGIYNVGTLPGARHRGFAAELLLRLMGDSAAAGHRLLFLQVQKDSGAERLYRRLGFRTAFTRTGYRLVDWPAGRGNRPSHPPRQPAGFLAALHLASPPTAVAEASVTRQVPAGLTERARAFASCHQIGPATLWVAAWAVLLSRYSHEDRVSFGLTFGGPLRLLTLSVPEQDSVPAWLREVDQQLANPAHSPWESASEEPPETVLHLGDSGAITSPRPEGTANLECQLLKNDRLQVGFDPRLFEPEAMERLAGHLLQSVAEIVEQGRDTVSAIDILTPRERQQIVREWNRASSSGAEVEPVHRLFEAVAKAQPDQVAALLLGGAAQEQHAAPHLTYADLNSRANQLARHLQDLGLGAEDVAGLCLERSLEMIIALLAILKAGAVVLPLDPGYPANRLTLMLSDARAQLVIAHEKTRRVLPPGPTPVLSLDGDAEVIQAHSTENLESTGTLQQAAYIIYTSGSTGQPKGVVITTGAIARHTLDTAAQYRLSRDDRVLQFNSLNFDAAFEQILTPLTRGARLVLRGPEIWTAHEFAHLLEQAELTVVDLPTAYWHQVLQHWTQHPDRQPAHWPRLWIVGGEVMPPEALRLWQQLPVASTRLFNAYGPTEATITATTFEVTPEFLRHPPHRVPIGRPRGERTAYVLDPSGRPVPVGVAGELYLGGPLLARGYLDQDRLTGERFVPDVFGEPGQRLYRTGDLVRYQPSGDLEFLGRVDRQVKIRGYRVELGEIEAALQEHPDVRESVVVVPQGTPSALAAFYVRRNGTGPSARELRQFLRQRLPDFMIPSSFTALEALPLLSSGKVDRCQLASAPLPASAPAQGARDPVELRLQLLFERILGQPNLAVDVSFFELGGDSLQALELIIELERLSQRTLPLETLYQSSSVEALARLLRDADAPPESSSLVALQTRGTRPPLFFVHTTPGDILGYGNLIYHLDREQPCYGFQSLGLCHPELSHPRIEEMAAHYVGLLRSVVPRGPYYLAGWCYGGIVAVEMAHQLLRLGGVVAFLGLLETLAPPPSWRAPLYYLDRVARFCAMKPRQWLTYFRKKAAYLRDAKRASKTRFGRVAQAADLDGAQVKAHNARLARLERVYNTNLHALRLYRSQPYPGRVTLFNAQDLDAGIIPDPYYGWRRLAAQVEVHQVPGDHDSMLTEPNVAVLARQFGQSLRKAGSSADPRPHPAAAPIP